MEEVAAPPALAGVPARRTATTVMRARPMNVKTGYVPTYSISSRAACPSNTAIGCKILVSTILPARVTSIAWEHSTVSYVRAPYSVTLRYTSVTSCCSTTTSTAMLPCYAEVMIATTMTNKSILGDPKFVTDATTIAMARSMTGWASTLLSRRTAERVGITVT